MAVKTSFRGAVSEIITPFDENSKLDLGLLQAEVDYQVESGIAALFSNGLAGESFDMNVDELIAVNKEVVRCNAGRLPIMANITGNNIENCMKLLRAYEDSGVQSICLTQPATYAFSQDALYEHMQTLAAATELPVCIYNAPQTSNTLTPATVAKLLNENDNVVYYKESTLDIIHMQNTMRLVRKDKEYEFLAGSDATIYPIMAMGGLGVVSLISTVFPKPIIKLCDQALAGDLEGAKKTQFEVLKLREVLKIGSFMAGYKYAAELIGIPMGKVKRPLTPLTSAQKDKLTNDLKELAMI